MSITDFTFEQCSVFGKEFPFGACGHVVLIDVMGSDKDIADAARKSYGRDASDRTPEQLRSLLRFMMRHGHTSPFEMAEMKFGVYLPMDVNRQLIRHRTANVNEFSTRYATAKEDVATVEACDWRLQSKDNKQGSDGFVDFSVGLELTAQQADLQERIRAVYDYRLSLGVAKEQARMDLPLSTYTDLVWKMDIHNLLHFLEKRLHPTAQQEIRDLANVIYGIACVFFPITMAAFDDYVRWSAKFSRLELVALRSLLKEHLSRQYVLQRCDGLIDNERERNEFVEKIESILGTLG